MLLVAGRIAVDPALAAELLADLHWGVASSRSEAGCLFYSFGMEDAAAGHIITLQIWRDEAALAEHLCQPFIGKLVGKWDGRYDVQTKLYDLAHPRAVGVWSDPKFEAMIRESRG